MAHPHCTHGPPRCATPLPQLLLPPPCCRFPPVCVTSTAGAAGLSCSGMGPLLPSATIAFALPGPERRGGAAGMGAAAPRPCCTCCAVGLAGGSAVEFTKYCLHRETLLMSVYTYTWCVCVCVCVCGGGAWGDRSITGHSFVVLPSPEEQIHCLIHLHGSLPARKSRPTQGKLPACLPTPSLHTWSAHQMRPSPRCSASFGSHEEAGAWRGGAPALAPTLSFGSLRGAPPPQPAPSKLPPRAGRQPAHM